MVSTELVVVQCARRKHERAGGAKPNEVEGLGKTAKRS